VLSWTPSFEQAGVYPMTVTVSDGHSTDSASFQVTVTDVNRPPVLAAMPDQTASAGHLVSVTPSASDPDGDALAFSGRLADGGTLPAGATLDPLTGQFQWATSLAQAGEYLLLIEVEDGRGGTASGLVTVTVLANQPPVVRFLAPADGDIITASEDVVVLVEASDPDADGAIAKVELFSGHRLVATDTDAPYAFSAALLPLGTHPLTARATDDVGLVAEAQIRVQVRLKDQHGSSLGAQPATVPVVRPQHPLTLH
jgi:hypothetical protein